MSLNPKLPIKCPSCSQYSEVREWDEKSAPCGATTQKLKRVYWADFQDYLSFLCPKCQKNVLMHYEDFYEVNQYQYYCKEYGG